MPKRTDISTILIIGAGPIVIGQACEFDYSGTQACKALKEEGYRVVLVNSNPATIMTDPELADATYIEPITPEIVAKIIEKERHVIPGGFALLPTMGGQTALNCALSLRRQGMLDKFDVEMIGATPMPSTRPRTAQLFPRGDEEDRPGDAEIAARQRLGAQEVRPRQIPGRARQTLREGAGRTRTAVDARRERASQALPGARARRGAEALSEIGLPAIIRPSFTMGGTGGGIAYNKEEFLDIIERGLDASPTTEVLIEESVLGWKEFEMEVVRDKKDNCIIVCSIENLDPMGVHTGDSITVAPALTLTDKEYQIMRDASIAVLREIGVETGGSNVQFARQSGRRPHGRDRDEPAGVALLRAGLEGDRVSDRQGRGQARGRLHARRDRQRHHRRRDAGLVRADHRLRRHQDPALRLREIPRRRADADHLDEVGRRGHGDRPHLPGIACRRRCAGWRPASPASTRSRSTASGQRRRQRTRSAPRSARRRRTGFSRWPRRCGSAGRTRTSCHSCKIDPWFLERDRAASSRWKTRSASTALPGDAVDMRAEGDGLLRCAARRARRQHRGRGDGEAPRARRPSGVQAHRHLRRRVRLADRLHVFDL